ncbi:MAG: 5-formyltetrahydrofolate cyclo-ligase [Candidatus Entotheonellia bacterium]
MGGGAQGNAGKAAIQARKRQIRRSMLALRRELSEAERIARSGRVAEQLTGLPCYQRARVILWYMAFENEVLTAGLIQQAIAAGKWAVLPLVQADRRQLELYEIRDVERDVAPGYRGIPEPRPERCRPVVAAELELVLVPGVAFDAQGGRLGFGAGFYDRLLAGLPRDIPKLGMAFDFQVLPQLPRQPHDMTLDGIVMERRVICCGRLDGEEGAGITARLADGGRAGERGE